MKKFLALALLVVSPFVQAEKSVPIFGQLGNGLRYALLPLHEEKGHLEVRIRVNAGAVDELDEQAGVAHMLEHLAFRATQKYSSGVMPYLHENGWVRGRNYNAVTTVDSTTYMFTPPKGKGLDQTLDVLSQMLLHANLTQSDLDDERKIIREEWRGGRGVGSRMNRQRTDAVREGSRYARFPVIGTKESIETMPAVQLQRFYQTWYAPNNMQLLIVGDLKPSEVEARIAQYFGQEKRRSLPVRDYLEPPLSAGLRTKQLQDPQSGVSQIAYIFRFDDSAHRAQTERGRYERLVDRIALATIAQRLRNQAEYLPEGVKSVVVRRSEIGRNTVGLGFFSSVAPTAQREGLAQIFTELERLKRYPITREELEAQKAKIQAQIDNAKKHQGDRDFSGWVQVMVDSFLLDRPYLTQPQIAARTEPMLHKISLTEINRRIADWLAVEDRVISYQAPRMTKIEPISAEFAENLQKQTARKEITPPQQEKVIEPMSLSPLSEKGSITHTERFDSQNVVRWTLSNGDKVVWLKSPLNKDRTIFQAVSGAGFKSQDLNAWQSQLAAQMIAQNAPLDWEIEQLNQWKQHEKVNLSIKQHENRLIFEGSASNDKLSALLRLFYAYQRETRVKDGLDEVKEDITRTLNRQADKSEEEERSKAVSLLRYGRELKDSLPDKVNLASLTAQELDQQWQTMTSAPVTYYLLNDMDEKAVKELIEQYLSAIPRGEPLNAEAILPISGRNESRFAMNIEPRDDVRMWFFTPHIWQGRDAVIAVIVRNIAANKLKLALRDETLGLYSLRFESQLNRESERLESELSFVANPELTESLIKQAETVLADLPNRITEADIEVAKSQFASAEQERLKLPQTWLHRLVLSFEQYDTPRYLDEMQHLASDINLDNVKAMAATMYERENVKVFVVTPK